ncbi:MAG: class I SAM-dependent methyltransferase [Gammaproteobacteria bacterium]
MADADVRAEYAALNEHYERRWRRYLAATIAHTLGALAPRPGKRILDVGCGTGLALARLGETATDLRLVGVDLSPEMLARARSRLPASVSLAHADARRLPFAAAQFDAVITSSALHYLDDPAPALFEAARVLAPGGRLIVTDWCRDFFVMFLCEHWLRIRKRPLGRVLRARELTALVEDAGLRVDSVTRFRAGPAWGLMTLAATRRI